ncbi:MAG: hypothetical protein ACJ72W_09025 [Actinoallomurus sp.]
MTDPALPGWTSAGTIDGVPLWRRTSEPVYVAATDRDQLAFLDVALEWFDTAGPQEFVTFIERKGMSCVVAPPDTVPGGLGHCR